MRTNLLQHRHLVNEHLARALEDATILVEWDLTPRGDLYCDHQNIPKARKIYTTGLKSGHKSSKQGQGITNQGFLAPVFDGAEERKLATEEGT